MSQSTIWDLDRCNSKCSNLDQSSKLKVWIFGTFASVCENSMLKKNFFNLTDIVRHYTLHRNICELIQNPFDIY